MSYNQSHRELSSEQLTSAEETLTEFKDVVVKFEEEFDGQHILLDFTRIPLIILHRIANHRESQDCLADQNYPKSAATTHPRGHQRSWNNIQRTAGLTSLS
ncbi:hypothetical protein AMECASPLE_021265 [Ameca splendens]|uniref:Uncharacterized protein n=2 Tax=Goodeidae TaxID=28758 RepID=A0ABV0P6X2_9TELE